MKNIKRDTLGLPVDFYVADKNKQQLNLINDKLILLMIGDQFLHQQFGLGMVEFISENGKSKYPIKMHFKEHNCFCYFNAKGMQYAEQEIPLVEFRLFVGTCYPKNDESGVIDQVFLENGWKGICVKDTWDKWDKRFIELAEHVAQWSKDPSTKVGAVIVDDANRIVSLGFNGYPQHVPDDDLHIRENKYAKILHGEMNALLFAQRDLSGCRLYVWPMPPCSRCASAIIQSGIEEVVTVTPSRELQKRWEAKNAFTEDMFESANVELRFLE